MDCFFSVAYRSRYVSIRTSATRPRVIWKLQKCKERADIPSFDGSKVVDKIMGKPNPSSSTCLYCIWVDWVYF